MAHPAADNLRRAAALNVSDDRRRGNVLHVDAGELIVTGDLHGRREALNKIAAYADVGASPSRLLVLQEIVHGPLDARTGRDRSIEVLLRAVRLKLDHPHEVLFVLGNHDVAEVTGSEITRDGQPSCRTFREGVRFAFGADAEEVIDALGTFLLSLPLTIRCANGVWVSHSLPGPDADLDACMDVLGRPYRQQDFRRGGGVYEWTWGRRHTPETVDALARRLEAAFFVIGHLHVPEGLAWVSPRAVSLASDHENGCLMRLDAANPFAPTRVETAVHRLAALAGPA